jgi:hypothetical protein
LIYCYLNQMLKLFKIGFFQILFYRKGELQVKIFSDKNNFTKHFKNMFFISFSKNNLHSEVQSFKSANFAVRFLKSYEHDR